MHRLLAKLVACWAALAVVSAENSTLQLVQVLFRHGARTPVIVCPSDPNSSQFLTEGLGQLTNDGKRMQYELGQFLRKRYGSFLPNRYNRNFTYVRSSDVDRTLMSAQANLAGLYPPRDDDVWNPGLAWQPIPVHAVPQQEDVVLNFLGACVRYQRELQRVLETDKFRQMDAENGPLYDYVSGQCGVQIRSLEALSLLYDMLLVESALNMTLPAWATVRLQPYNTTVFPGVLEPINTLAFRVLSWDASLRRLGGGPLLAQLTSNMLRKVAGSLEPPSRRLFVYSGHDADIAAVLGALDAYSGVPPPLASCLIFELHRDPDGAFSVQLFYRNDTTAPPHQLHLPDCTPDCPWEAFLDVTAAVRPADAAAECATTPGVPSHLQTVVIALATVLALLLVVCVLAVLVYGRMRRRNALAYSHFGAVSG